jgi:hypothetical protein
MNHIEYGKIMYQLHAEHDSEEQEKTDIRIVYTPESLVEAGEKVMRERQEHNTPPPSNTAAPRRRDEPVAA